mmetsp:Transcript_23122/g.30686  ORF Transcript_23122/g.30686 Transcript_23122/m.30686 type:complete len:89 (-) Transcript_23122:469-735(-)
MHWDSLESKLHSVAAARDYCPSSPSNASASSGGGVSTGGGGVSDEEQKKLKHEAFQRRRKAHYNEAEAMRRFRVEHPGGLTDDEDEDE